MKKLLLTLGIALAGYATSFAQWQDGTNIFNTNSGNVGIGTTNPVSKLHIESNDANGVQTLLRNAAGTSANPNMTFIQAGPSAYGVNGWTNSSILESGDVGNLVLSSYFGNILFQNNARTNRMIINSSGNVGIGTTSPALGFKLDVNGMGNFAGVNLTAQSRVTSDIAFGTVSTGQYVGQYFSSADQNLKFYNGTGGADILALNQTNNGVYVLNGPFSVGANFTVKHDGSVGLTTGTGILFGTYASPSVGQYFNGGDNKLKFYNGIGGAEILNLDQTNNNVIVPNGSLSIGVDNPVGYKLAVNGSAIAESVTVKLHSSWPDYVFKKEYNLLSLADVKEYIDKNEHLPDMPSEQEVAKNGINLGEIVKVQTKKIEELTLYLIEQQMINQSLQNQIDQLAKKK